MKIHFERTGGFTGIPLRAEIDTVQLSAEENEILRALVDSAGFYGLPATISSPSGGADRFHFHLSIEDRPRSHTVEVDEAAIPQTLQPLLQRVILLARQARRG